MYYYNTPFFGMHFLWWVFWFFLWVMLFSFWTPVSRTRWRTLRETPHEVLHRRFASGELSEEQYEKSKAILDRDAPQTSRTIPRRSRGWWHSRSEQQT